MTDVTRNSGGQAADLASVNETIPDSALERDPFDLPAAVEQLLHAERRPTLERTGPRSTRADAAGVAERDNRGRIYPSRRLGRKGGAR